MKADYDLGIPIPSLDPDMWGDNLPRFIKAMEKIRKPDGRPLRIVYLLNEAPSGDRMMDGWDVFILIMGLVGLFGLCGLLVGSLGWLLEFLGVTPT